MQMGLLEGPGLADYEIPEVVLNWRAVPAGVKGRHLIMNARPGQDQC